MFQVVLKINYKEWKRIYYILNKIKKGDKVKAKEMAKLFNCSTRTIYRDLKFLKKLLYL